MKSEHTLSLSEEERQMLLLALGHLSVARPGWDDALNRLALKLDNESDGRAQMYDDFRRLSVAEIEERIFDF